LGLLFSARGIFAIGASTLVIGYGVNLYINSVIEGLRAQLQETGLTVSQRATLQESLNSWQIQRITLLQPFSYLLMSIGFIVILSSVIYTLLAVLWRETQHRTFDQTKQEIFENAPKTRTVHTTGFPIAAGILAIIAASIIIFNALLAVAQTVNLANSYYYQQNLTYLVFVLFAGIWNFIAFGLGLAGGIFSIKRKHFALTIVGMSFLLVGGFISVFESAILGGYWSYGMIIGMPIIILTMLSIIFVGVSKNEFT
jgi:hypothetical protein